MFENTRYVYNCNARACGSFETRFVFLSNNVPQWRHKLVGIRNRKHLLELLVASSEGEDSPHANQDASSGGANDGSSGTARVLSQSSSRQCTGTSLSCPPTAACGLDTCIMFVHAEDLSTTSLMVTTCMTRS